MSNLTSKLIEDIKKNIKHNITELEIDDLLDKGLIDKEFSPLMFKEFLKEDLIEQEEEESSLMRYLENFKRDTLLSFTDSSIGKDIPSLATNHVIDKFANDFNSTKHIEFNSYLAKTTSYILSIFLNYAKTSEEKDEVERFLRGLKDDLGKDRIAEQQFFTVFSLVNNLIKIITVDQNYSEFFTSIDSCIMKLKGFMKESPFTVYLVKDTVIELSNVIVKNILQEKVEEKYRRMGIHAIFKLGLCFQHLDLHIEFIRQLLKHDYEYNFREEFTQLIDQLFGYSLGSNYSLRSSPSQRPEPCVRRVDSGLRRVDSASSLPRRPSVDSIRREPSRDDKTNAEPESADCFTCKQIGLDYNTVNKTAITTDGKFIFLHQKNLGLLKIGTGKSNTKQGVLYCTNEKLKPCHDGTLVYACGKLYFRSPSTSPAPFIAIDPASLKELPLNFSNGQEKYHFIDTGTNTFDLPYQLLPGYELMDTHRDKTMSWLVSDNRYLYIVSKIGELKVLEKENPRLYPENCLYNVDIFDPLNNCDYVSSFPLIDQNRILSNGKMSLDPESGCIDVATDGVQLIFRVKEKVVYYNLVSRRFSSCISLSESETHLKSAIDLINSQRIVFGIKDHSAVFSIYKLPIGFFHKDLIGNYADLSSVLPANLTAHEMFSSISIEDKSKEQLKDVFNFFCAESTEIIQTPSNEKTYDKWTNASLLLSFLARSAKNTLNFTQLNKLSPLTHLFSPHTLSLHLNSLTKLHALYKDIIGIAGFHCEAKHFFISSLLTLFNAHLRQITTLQFTRLTNFKSDFAFLKDIVNDAVMFIKEFIFMKDLKGSLSSDLICQCLQIVENYANVFDIEYPNMTLFLDMIIDPSPHLADLKRSALVSLSQSKVIFENESSITFLAQTLDMIIKRNQIQIIQQAEAFVQAPQDARPSFSIDYEKAFEGLVTPFLKLLFDSYFKISASKDDIEKAQNTEDFHRLLKQFEQILHILIQHMTELMKSLDGTVKLASSITSLSEYIIIVKRISEVVVRSSYAYRLFYASLLVFSILSKDRQVIYKTWHLFFDVLILIDQSFAFHKAKFEELVDLDDKQKKLEAYERIDWMIETPHPIRRRYERSIRKEFTRPYNICIEFDPFCNTNGSTVKIKYTDQAQKESSLKFENEFKNQVLQNVTKIEVSVYCSDEQGYGLKIHIHNSKKGPQIFTGISYPTVLILMNSIKSFFFFNYSKSGTKDKDLEEMLQSKLFSGGIDELLDLQTFSEEYKTFISILKANPNYSLFEKRLSFEKENLEDVEGVPFEYDEILNKENVTVEKFIDYAQFALKPRFPWIAIGGDNAGAIVRGAFAVVMKQEKLYDIISQAVGNFNQLEESKKVQRLTLKELSGIENFEYLLLIWTEVSRLRQWYSEQIKDIAEAKKDDFDKQNEDFVKSIVEKCRFLFQLNAQKKGSHQKMKTGSIKFLELFAQSHLLANQKVPNDIVMSNVLRFKKNLMQGKIEESNPEMENSKRNIQSVVNCIKLTKISIESLKSAIREMNTKAKFREIALSLINSILSEVQVPTLKLAVIKQIIYSLRLTSGKKLISIDEEIRSASPSILTGITNRFHQFLGFIFGSMLSVDNSFLVAEFMDCLFWNFKARDHQVLIQMGVLENLFINSPNEIIRKAWKKITQPKMKNQYHVPNKRKCYECNTLCAQLMELFQALATSIVGRVIEETHTTSEFNEQNSGFVKKKSSVFDNSFEKLIESIGIIIKARLEDFTDHYLNIINNLSQYEKCITDKNIREAFANEYFDESFLTLFLLLLYKFTVNHSAQILKYMKNPEFLSNLFIILRFTSTKNKVPLINILKVYLTELKDEDMMNIVFFLKKKELFKISLSSSLFFSEEMMNDNKISPKRFICLYLLESMYMLRKALYDPNSNSLSNEYEECAFIVNMMRFLYSNPKWGPTLDEIFTEHLTEFDSSSCIKYPVTSLILSVLNGDFDEIHYGSKVLLKYKSDYSKSIPEKIKDKLEDLDSCVGGYVLGFLDTDVKVRDFDTNKAVESFFMNQIHTRREPRDKFVLILTMEKDSYSKNKLKSNDVEFQTKSIQDVVLSPEIDVKIGNTPKLYQKLIEKYNEMLAIFSKQEPSLYELYIFNQFSRSVHSLFNSENIDVKHFLRSAFSMEKIQPVIQDLSTSPYTCIKINQWQTMNFLKCWLDSKSASGFNLRDKIEPVRSAEYIRCNLNREIKALKIYKDAPQNGHFIKILKTNLEMRQSNSENLAKLKVVRFGDKTLEHYLNCLILVNLESDEMKNKIAALDDACFVLLISCNDIAYAKEKITHPYIVVNSNYEQLEMLLTQLDNGVRSNEMNLEKCDPEMKAIINKIQAEAKADDKIKFAQCNSINPQEVIQQELNKTSAKAETVTKKDLTNCLYHLAQNYLRYFVVHLLHENPSIVNADNFDFIAKQFKIVYIDACEISNLSVFSYKKFSYLMQIFSMLIEKEEEINPKVKLMNISERSRIFNSYTFSISEVDICRNIQSELIDYFYENELFKKASNPSAEVYLDLVLKVMKLSIITINYESKTFNQYLSKLLDLMYKLFTFVSSHADTISEEMAEQFVKQIRREGLDKIFVYLSDSITEEKDNPSNRTKNLINFAFEFARIYTDMFRKGWNISKGFSFNYISSAMGSLMFNINILHLKAKYTELRDKSLFQNPNILDKLTSDISLPYSKSPIEVNFDYKGVNSLRITPKNPISRGKMLIGVDLGKNGVYSIGRAILDTDASSMELNSQQKVLLHNRDDIKQELWMCGSNESYRFGNPNLSDTTYYSPQKSQIELTSLIKKIVVLPASTVVITMDNKAYVSGGSTNSGLSDYKRQFCLESRWNEIAKEKVIDFSVNTNNGSCMVTEKAVWVKGNNGNNCFGDVCSSGYDADFVMWTTPFLAKTVSELACGYCHTIFRLDDGTCYGAGCNNEYELTLPSRENIRTLTKLNIGDNPCVKVSCGSHLSLFLIREPDGNQRVYSCGTEEYNGRGSSNDKVFKKIPALADLSFRYCRVGYCSSLAITTNGKLYTWGQCGYYNLGDEQTNVKYEPTLAYYYKDRTVLEAEITERILAVKAVDTDGKTKIWISGYNGNGLFACETSSSYNTKPVELTFFGDANVKVSVEGSNYAISFLKSNFDTLQQCFEFKCSKCQASKSTPMAIHDKKLLCMDCYKSDDQLKVTLGIRGCRMDNVENLVLPDLVEINQAGTKTPHEIACVDCKKKIGEGIAVIAADNPDMTKVISFCEDCYPYSSYFASPKFVFFVKGEINYSALPVISNHAELLGLDMQNPIKASHFRALNDDGKREFFKECGDILDTINKEYDEIRSEHILEYIKTIEADPSKKAPEELRKINILSKMSNSQFVIIEGLVTKLNQSLKDLRRFIYMDEPNIIKDIYIANLIFMSKNARNELFENIIYDGSSNVDPSSFILRLSRGKAYKFKQRSQVDYQGQYTIFGQSFNQLKNAPLSQFKGSKSNRMFKVELYGEGATDAGGPYREIMNVMCEELQSPWLDLFIPTPNNKSTSGQEREKWTINPSAKSGTHLEMFTLLGKLFGFAARSLGFLNLNLPSFIWKQILGQPLDMNDLEKIDIHTANFLSDLMSLEAKGIDKNQFEYIYDQQFTTILSNGKEVEVQAGGSNMKLSYENSQEYVRLALKTRFEECVVQIEALKAGFFEVIKKEVALLINWKDLEERICGNLIVDVELLKKNTDYESWYSSEQIITWFWQAINNFSNEEKILYLKFVWGRSRLPLSDGGFDRKHKITKMYSSHSDISLPVSHTCFFTLDLPQYSSYEILYNKLLYAIKFCNEIDNDYNASSALEDI